MFNKKKNTTMFVAAGLAMSMSASSFAAFELIPNGDFSVDWTHGKFEDGGAGSYAAVSPTGGNGGGYGLASAANGGWGAGFVWGDAPQSAADYGYSGGDTMNFLFDMKADGSNAGETGIKVESWADGAFIAGSDIQVDIDVANTDWNTYSHSYTLAPGANQFKVVLVGTNTGGEVGFDNIKIDNVSAVPVPAAAWLFGSALAGLTAIRRRK
jgi:hypothetical protein